MSENEYQGMPQYASKIESRKVAPLEALPDDKCPWCELLSRDRGIKYTVFSKCWLCKGTGKVFKDEINNMEKL